MTSKIYIGSDHAGFNLKNKLILELKNNPNKFSKTIQLIDEGTYSKDSCDYPFYAKEVANKVKTTNSKGILICGTGIGMSIVANKVKGIRAAHVCDELQAKLSKEHNNSNILCISGKNSINKSIKIINSWLDAKTSNLQRHKRRRNMIEF